MTDLELYSELEDFMHWLAWGNVDENKAMMNHDDIFGELQVEFVKSLNVYGDLPQDEFIKVTKRMFDNRISELKYKYYQTHRGIPGTFVSLHDLFHGGFDGGFNLEKYAQSRDFVSKVRNELSDETLEIFDMIIFGDDRLGELLRLCGMRASHVYTSRGTIRIKTWHIADVMMISVGEARKHLSHIEEIVRRML